MDNVPRAECRAQAVTGPFPSNGLLLLHLALRWWQSKDFEFVDLPWMVPKEFSDATRPEACRDIPTLHGSFVASGEQSFLYLWELGQLPEGVPGYVGWTPCLRDDDLDELHQHGFMKVEVFMPVSASQAPHWMDLVSALTETQAQMFQSVAMHAGAQTAVTVTREKSGEQQWDLLIGGIEVGSYGLREFKGRVYIYGTALAMPRFIQALQHAGYL